MTTELITHAKTRVIQMGFPKLYEALAFKENKDEAKTDNKDNKVNDKDNKTEKTSGGSGRSYGFPVLLDKDNPEHMQTVEILKKLSKNAQKKAINSRLWGKKDRLAAHDGLKDVDEDEILDGDKTVLMVDKYPNRANHYYVNFNRSEKKGRPGIRYIDETGQLRELPKPRLDAAEVLKAAEDELEDARIEADEADETEREDAENRVLAAEKNLEEAKAYNAEAKKIKAFWDELVYPGQNVQASVTVSAWKSPNGGSGISYRLDNLTIVGGGTRSGGFTYDEDFTDDDISALIAWRDNHLNAKSSPSDAEAALLAEDDDEDIDIDVDEATGEVASKPRRKAKPVVMDEDEDEEEEPRPRKRAITRRRKPVEDVDDTDDEDEEARPVKRSTTRRRKQVEVEDDYDDDEDVDEEFQPRRRRKASEDDLF
ncbi:DUF2815 domain-containing protein [Bifidobacterium sp. SO1]|uniref:DUF2815 domain-containing protein n=1 Tax=Bifidobacterium sp. SO1 TaxID=2809029 RepID=UPI001BDBDBC2|nr:DUF2815 domain-containing protein [Bifidobacterium sp. SO1]MBT1162562.1 DUF2815 domain-containing protein [Bifidobacterium sp. SO1]